MPNLNKVLLIGHTTDAPETKAIPSGTLCKFTLAVNSGHGEKKETCFAECVCFGKTAEIVPKYAGKGACLYVEGRLRLESWEDKETGRKRSKISIVAESVQFMDKKKAESEQETPPQPAPQRQERRYSRGDAQPPMPEMPDEMPEDDIPF